MFDFGLSLMCFISLVFSLNNLWPALEEGRTPKAQAGYQVAGLAVALGIAIIGGIVTGKEQFLFFFYLFSPKCTPLKKNHKLCSQKY